MPTKKLPAKTRALRRFKSTGTKAGRAQDKRLKAETVGIKDYNPQVNDYEGVDTPRKSVKKAKPAAKRLSTTWSKLAAAALKEAARKYRAQKRK